MSFIVVVKNKRYAAVVEGYCGDCPLKNECGSRGNFECVNTLHNAGLDISMTWKHIGMVKPKTKRMKKRAWRLVKG